RSSDLTAQGHPDQMREFLDQSAKERAFIDLFARTREELKKLYASDLPEAQMKAGKAAVFARLTQDVRELQRQQGNYYYEPWLREGLNNAHLVSVATYYQCVPGFQRLLAQQGGDMVRFYAAARARSKQPRAVRHAQLCELDVRTIGTLPAGR